MRNKILRRLARDDSIEEQELWLRKLRFPSAIEQAFKVHYAKSSIGPVRFALIILTLLVMIMTIASISGADAGKLPSAALWISVGLVAFNLLLFGATYLQTYLNNQQVIMALWPAVYLTGSIQLVVRGPVEPAATVLPGLALPAFLVCTVLASYAILRIRLVLASIICWSAVCGYLLLAQHAIEVLQSALKLKSINFNQFTTDSEAVRHNVVDLLVFNLIGMIIAYQVEQSSRRDFLYERSLSAEREKSELLLLNVLPRPIAERLKSGETVIADRYEDVTVMFADIVGFTPMSAKLEADEIVQILNQVFTRFDVLAKAHGLEKIKTMGDAYMVVGGLPEPCDDHVEASMAMAIDMVKAVQELNLEKELDLAIRIGIHVGPVVAGVIGQRKFSYDLWGGTVNVAKRVESYGSPGRIQVSEPAFGRLEGKFDFEPLRMIDVKGIGPMNVAMLKIEC